MKSEARKKTVGYNKAAQMTEEQRDVIEAHVGAFLEKTYPGYYWYIEVVQDLVKVTSPAVNKDYGFIMSIDDIQANMHKVMLAGGEILERCNMDRRGATIESLYNAKRDILGNITPDD